MSTKKEYRRNYGRKGGLKFDWDRFFKDFDSPRVRKMRKNNKEDIINYPDIFIMDCTGADVNLLDELKRKYIKKRQSMIDTKRNNHRKPD